MKTHFKKLVGVSTFATILSGLTTIQSFAADPPQIQVNLYNNTEYLGRYLVGLFHKEPGASSYQQTGAWLASGASTHTPTIPKGSKFCVSITGAQGSAYDNYYYNSDGHAPEWFNQPVGNANLNFYGALNVGGIKWNFNGEQTAGLIYESTASGQSSACSGEL